MAVQIKLCDYQTLSDGCLGRSYIGCFPRMTEDEAWQAGRGVWKMNWPYRSILTPLIGQLRIQLLIKRMRFVGE